MSRYHGLARKRCVLCWFIRIRCRVRGKTCRKWLTLKRNPALGHYMMITTNIATFLKVPLFWTHALWMTLLWSGSTEQQKLSHLLFQFLIFFVKINICPLRICFQLLGIYFNGLRKQKQSERLNLQIAIWNAYDDQERSGIYQEKVWLPSNGRLPTRFSLCSYKFCTSKC